MRRTRSILRAASGVLAVLTAGVLAGCGGGFVPAPVERVTTASLPTSGAADVSARKRPLASEEITFVFHTASIFDYAERTYPALFPGPRETQTQGTASYRTYATGNTIAVQGDQIYLAGPVIGSPTPAPFQTVTRFCNATPAACGQTERRTMMLDGWEREYFVYVPWTVRTRLDAPPVVFAVHGSGGNGRGFLADSGWKEVADREGFLVVAPSALMHCFLEDSPGGNRDGLVSFPEDVQVETKWASGPLGTEGLRSVCTAAQRAALLAGGRIDAETLAQLDHPVPDDVAFFRDIVAELATVYAPDLRRLYVSGFSNGGEMAFRLAAEASTTFAAVTSAAGVVERRELQWPLASRPMSMVYTIGALNNRDAPLPVNQDVYGIDASFTSRVNAFLGIQGLADTHRFAPVQVAGSGVGLYQFDTSERMPAGGNQLFVGVMQGLGHEFPVSLPPTLWSFFRTQALP